MTRLEESLTAWPANGLPTTLAARTRRVYDRLAAVYPMSTMLFHSRAHRCALEASGVRNGMKVLEVATGSGEMFRRLVRANRKGWNTGVDLSPNMAARTQR
ncbi:MAG: methyltransferase type 11, partial [Candidatus Sulfopaludibacter sp.]|nr:methyltransferase type 11 [Candidatus Sulfopaludibacter sp.]